jgi:hypothetical protein
MMRLKKTTILTGNHTNKNRDRASSDHDLANNGY